VYSIGEFSRITGLSVKTLRFYHEEGLLVPSCVDEQTSYRYYAPAKIEVARAISRLRELDLPLADIAEILRSYGDDSDMVALLERHREFVAERLQHFRGIVKSLDQLIARHKEDRMTAQTVSAAIEHKSLEPMLIAAIRMRARYSECGSAFGRIARHFGRHIAGPPFLLHYDSEYREEDANYEACFPVRQRKEVVSIEVRELAGGPCIALVHKGPYEDMGRSYAKIFDHIKAEGLNPQLPTREVYLKGPGMIFKGNPKKYLTEIQVMVEPK
jgi:DNA-binding transcriptional MerR regulator